MKLFCTALITLFTATPTLAAEYQPGYSSSQTCTRNEYREEYIPGTRNSPGYVKAWDETVEVPCTTSRPVSTYSHPHRMREIDDNDCSEGTVIGGLLGAGLTMSGTRGKDRWWAVPAGGAAGAMLGCQIDGG